LTARFLLDLRREVQAGCTFRAQEIEMTSLRANPTRTLLAKVKRLAKARARDSETPHTQCLDIESVAAGYVSWHELQQACATAAAAPGKEEFVLVLDPKLPPWFDQRANQLRSKRHLDTWWDKPFAITAPGGQGFEVRCLDGGAWDRSTWYGFAKTLPEATELAKSKLAWWKGARAAPHTITDELGPAAIRMPQRPDQDFEILYRAKDQEDLAA
jgi:hypothetical protein